jgi:hypothetical protein
MQRPTVPDAGGTPLAVLAPDHLADGLELTVALDVGVEQARCRWQRCFRRPRCFGGPARCHGAVGLGWISVGGRLLEWIGCTSSSEVGGSGDVL